jgi:copper resistance protein C
MRILITALSLLVLSLGSSGARAHAFLERAGPLVGSTVGAVPSDVSLTFTQNLEGAFSTVQVTGPDGARIDLGKPQVSGNTMRVGIKASGAGTYHVRWRALSVIHIRRRGASRSTSAGGNTTRAVWRLLGPRKRLCLRASSKETV